MKSQHKEKFINRKTVTQLENIDNRYSGFEPTQDSVREFLLDIVVDKLENYDLLKTVLKDNLLYFNSLLELIQNLSDNNKLKINSTSGVICNLINIVAENSLGAKKYRASFVSDFEDFSTGEVILKGLNILMTKHLNKNLKVIPHIESAYIFEQKSRFSDLVYFLLNNIMNFSQESSEIKILSYVKDEVYKFSVVCDLSNKKFCAKDFENCFELAFAKYIVKQQKGVIKYSLLNKNILIFEFSILS